MRGLPITLTTDKRRSNMQPPAAILHGTLIPDGEQLCTGCTAQACRARACAARGVDVLLPGGADDVHLCVSHCQSTADLVRSFTSAGQVVPGLRAHIHGNPM